MAEIFTDCSIKKEKEIYFAEHETHLSFNSDWQSEAFEDWLEKIGLENFAEWLKENEENYRD